MPARCAACVAAALIVLASLGCGGAKLDSAVAKRLAVAKAAKTPAYWLGARYDGLDLVHVEAGSDAFFTSSLYYADCSWFEMNTMSPRCRRVIEVDNDVPTPGEISSMGRCIFSTRIHSVTVATFPVNAGVLRVFARGATIYVSTGARAKALDAIEALKPLNGRRLEPRPVSLGTCKAPPPKRRVRLSGKQRYESRMKGTFAVQVIGQTNLGSVDPVAARPKALLREFLADTATEPALLRNMAARIAAIHPPAGVAALHARLVAELRADAAVVDAVRARAARDGLDEEAWRADEAELQPRADAAAAALGSTVRAFQARGYTIFVKPGD